MKRGIVLGLDIILFLIILLLPLPLNIRKGMAILIFTAVLWITEALPLSVTSLSVPILAVCLGVTNVKDAFAPFAHPIIFLFLGGFALAAALSKYEMDRFLAFKIVSLSRGYLLGASLLLFIATAFISMWISNTSTTAMMLPLSIGIAEAAGADRKLKTFILLGVAYSASVGGIGMLVGSPPNGITAAELGIGFTDWAKYGIPISIVLLILLFVILYLYFRPSFTKRVSLEIEGFELDNKRIGVLLIFLLTAIMWLFSKQLSGLLGVHKYLDAVIAVLAIVLLFVFKLVDWKDIDRGTDWGTLYLFGGGLALSRILKVTHTSSYIANLFVGNIKGLPIFLIVFLVALFMALATELMSNTATAAIFIPIFITAARDLGIPAETLAIPAGIAASCAFMLPVATPPNAIVYGTGAVRQKDMIKVGIILEIVSAIAISAVFTLI